MKRHAAKNAIKWPKVQKLGITWFFRRLAAVAVSEEADSEVKGITLRA
jgi:hypothetical protein